MKKSKNHCKLYTYLRVNEKDITMNARTTIFVKKDWNGNNVTKNAIL